MENEEKSLLSPLYEIVGLVSIPFRACPPKKTIIYTHDEVCVVISNAVAQVRLSKSHSIHQHPRPEVYFQTF